MAPAYSRCPFCHQGFDIPPAADSNPDAWTYCPNCHSKILVHQTFGQERINAVPPKLIVTDTPEILR